MGKMLSKQWILVGDGKFTGIYGLLKGCKQRDTFSPCTVLGRDVGDGQCFVLSVRKSWIAAVNSSLQRLNSACTKSIAVF